MPSNHQFRVSTFNSNGVKSKLQQFISEISKSKCSTFCIQEIHQIDNYIFEIERGCKGKVFCKSGFKPRRKKIVIFNKSSEWNEILGNVQRDDQGRFIEVDVKIIRVKLTIASMYCPNDNAQSTFFTESKGTHKMERNILLAGDFNNITMN